MVLSLRHISGGYYTHHDDLIKDFPYSLDYIKHFTKPLRKPNELFKPVNLKHRLPCFKCGRPSEKLEWFTTNINSVIHRYMGQVSICPSCGNVVEYFTEGRFRLDEPVKDEIDVIEYYADCWNTLSIGDLEDYLSEDFQYSSTWVLQELDKDGYLEYLSKKLVTLYAKHSFVKARIKNDLVLVEQDGEQVAIKLQLDNGKIIRADMSPASFYGYPDKIQKISTRYELMGKFCFHNNTPLKGSNYVDCLDEKEEFRIVDESKINNSADWYSRKNLKQIAEDCDWSFLDYLAKNNRDKLEEIKNCYLNAAQDGVYEAANNLGIIIYNYEDQEEKAINLINQAASAGSHNAMINQFMLDWNNKNYLEAKSMLANMLTKADPSLMCLFNLALLYYKGEIEYLDGRKNTKMAICILKKIIAGDYAATGEGENKVVEKAQELLHFITTKDKYEIYAREFHRKTLPLMLRVDNIKDKQDIFRTLSNLRMKEGYHLGLHIANDKTTDIGDESYFYAYNEKEDRKDILNYISAIPSEISAWQIYLLMTSSTVMPVFWHGGYITRKFVFSEDDLLDIPQLRHLDLSALLEKEQLSPKIETEDNYHTSNVYCCYWNDWKGLVREKAIITFNGNSGISYKAEDANILYSYDCGICF